jgi:threonine 3-dehydrogenase
VLGINGRRMYENWYQMEAMLKSGMLNLDPVITDRIPMKDIEKGMAKLNNCEACKILLHPNGTK